MDSKLKTTLGVIVLLMTACTDALGQNIQRRDHCKNNASSKPRHECVRRYWHMGFFIFVIGSLLGNAIGLQLVHAHLIAPAITTSLIFNVIFARYLVGTRINWRDLVGTAIIISAILSLLALTTFAAKDDVNLELNPNELRFLFGATVFKISLGIINLFLASGLAGYFYMLSKARKAESQAQLRNTAILISVVGGVCASETIIFAKTGVLMFQAIFTGKWSSLDVFSVLVIIGLAASVLLQLFCINAGLKLADSVVVSPIFSSVYNVVAIFNTLVLFQKYKSYEIWAICLMVLAVCILVVGIVILTGQLKPEPESLPKLPRFKCTKKRLPTRLSFNGDSTNDPSSSLKLV
ncbi:hypothetical protein DSO57_1025444 [Entomophthora muscae]|uniref:Uncharacterized protein n=1 Tax=Entomophthora muscae TaxID=34485 RepID=A0ACC2TDR7_9FUNG|nr:hypothetical protein DSO57_1025444 [Entomophthora muscae]